MFETDKKLEDFIRNNVMVTEADFDKMSYQERCQLYNDHPEEYRRVTHKGTTPQKKMSGHKCSSQITDKKVMSWGNQRTVKHWKF